jgi:hypothetical protein
MFPPTKPVNASFFAAGLDRFACCNPSGPSAAWLVRFVFQGREREESKMDIGVLSTYLFRLVVLIVRRISIRAGLSRPTSPAPFTNCRVRKTISENVQNDVLWRTFGHAGWNSTNDVRSVFNMDVLRLFPYLTGLLNRMTIPANAAASLLIRVRNIHDACERRIFPLCH